MGKSNTGKNTNIPEFGRLVKSIEEFYDIAKYVAHFAVKRFLGYFHHYIVTGWFGARKKVIEYYSCLKNFFTGPGEVAKSNISEKEIKEAIAEKKLYVIEAPGYPKTEREREQAKERCWKRLGEQAYSLASNNCEHLINYIMTGIPYSEQIMNAGVWKRLFIDSVDILICHGKRNLLKLSGCLVKPAYSFVRVAANEVLNIVAEVISSPVSNTADSAAGRCTSNLCNAACKNPQYTKSQLLASQKCVDVAQAASKEALKKTVGATLIITGLVEGGIAAYEIHKLKKQRMEGDISERDFHREVSKNVSGAVSATAGTVAGGVIGQAVCPIPVVGFIIGSTLGNILGRWFGTAVSGQVFDIVT